MFRYQLTKDDCYDDLGKVLDVIQKVDLKFEVHVVYQKQDQEIIEKYEYIVPQGELYDYIGKSIRDEIEDKFVTFKCDVKVEIKIVSAILNSGAKMILDSLI